MSTLPRQRDIDYLIQQLWRARVYLNQQRKLHKHQPVTNDIPPLLRELKS